MKKKFFKLSIFVAIFFASTVFVASIGATPTVKPVQQNHQVSFDYPISTPAVAGTCQ